MLKDFFTKEWIQIFNGWSVRDPYDFAILVDDPRPLHEQIVSIEGTTPDCWLPMLQPIKKRLTLVNSQLFIKINPKVSETFTFGLKIINEEKGERLPFMLIPQLTNPNGKPIMPVFSIG